tara:strand:- start:1807 stop:2022 length:216 start_codon:yes stop_codon:yes gene_type:complete
MNTPLKIALKYIGISIILIPCIIIFLRLIGAPPTSVPTYGGIIVGLFSSMLYVAVYEAYKKGLKENPENQK